jgi:hypothetical protein
MADAAQTIVTVGMPTLAVLVGILVNNSRLSDLKSHMDARFEGERRGAETNFKMLLGKMDELDHRLTRLEDRFERFAR